MPRASSYKIDSNISGKDIVFGSDGDKQFKSKNFSVEDLKTFFTADLQASNQDNIIKSLSFISDNTTEGAKPLVVLKDLINTATAFTVASTEIYFFNLTFQSRFYVFSFKNIGKGTYGTGQTQIAETNLQLISEKDLAVDTLQEDSSTDTINLFNIGSTPINEAVNNLDPAIEIQPVSEGFTIFEATQDGEARAWFYQGDSGTFGLGEGQTVLSDFDLLKEVSSSLKGTNYIYVQGDGTPIQNATELQSAYNQAKTLSPTSDNVITIICGSGEYKFPNTFVMDTPYIDLVSLTGNPDVLFDLENDPITLDASENFTNIEYALLIQADNVYVKGISGKTINSPNYNIWYAGDPLFSYPYIQGIDIGNNLPNVKIENCISGPWSFGSDYLFEGGALVKELSGTYINCKALNFSFAYQGTASGTFVDCHIIRPQGFTDEAYDGFGYGNTASGYFERCSAIDGGFANDSIATGTFVEVTTSFRAFGKDIPEDTFSGKIIRCTLKDRSASDTTFPYSQYPKPTGNGEIINSIDGNGQTVNIYATNEVNFRNIPASQFGTSSAPLTGNITQDLTVAKRGQVQNIYHNDTVAPTFPATWDKVKPLDYSVNELNIIEVEWIDDTRQEYRIKNSSEIEGNLEAIDEGNGIGYRIKGRDPDFYGNIGLNAVDLSESNTGTGGRGATGSNSYAEGLITIASGDRSHAEGSGTLASGLASHAEGHFTGANASYSHAEGYFTDANGTYSHAEGFETTAGGNSSHAEGSNTISSGGVSHAEGGSTLASGLYSHAEGLTTTASGRSAHSQGEDVFSRSYGEHSGGVFGTDYTPNSVAGFNSEDRLVNYGNGTSTSARSDAFTIYKNGAVRFFRATLASITNTVKEGMLIFNSGDNNRPTINNGTDWKGLAYTDDLKNDGTVTVSANQTLDLTNFGNSGQAAVYADASAGAITITLPTSATLQGYTVNVIKTDSSANAVTVKGSGTELINALNTFDLTNQYDPVRIKSNGTQNFIF